MKAGISLLYGISEALPTLPPGWQIIETEKDYAVVRSPDGAEFFCGDPPDTLYPRRTVPPDGDTSVHKPGSVWIDTKHPVRIVDLPWPIDNSQPAERKEG